MKTYTAFKLHLSLPNILSPIYTRLIELDRTLFFTSKMLPELFLNALCFDTIFII